MGGVAIEILMSLSTPRAECVRGHLLKSKNIYVTPKGYIHCRLCRSIADRNHRAKLVGKQTNAIAIALEEGK
jgi:hypothetical protein